jgi:hypothetical protein
MYMLSSESESELELPPAEKLKVCMYKNTGDHEAQMLGTDQESPR